MIREVKLSDAAATQRLNAGSAWAMTDGKRRRLNPAGRGAENDQHFDFGSWREDGQVIGYAHAASYDCLYFPSLLNLIALAVAQDFQGQGHGRALMQALRDKDKTADLQNSD